MSTNRGRLGPLPLELIGKITTEYLENEDIHSFFQTNNPYREDRLKLPPVAWTKKFLASGCEKKMLDAVISRNIIRDNKPVNVIRDYQRLYQVFTSLHPIIRAQINKPWQLLCLSGEKDAIENAFEHEAREMLAESQWYYPDPIPLAPHSHNRLFFNTRQLIALSCSPQGLNFAASHPQLKKLKNRVKENITISIFAGSSPALRFFYNSLSPRKRKAYRKLDLLLLALRSGCTELIRILQPDILPGELRRGGKIDLLTAAIMSGSEKSLSEAMKLWSPSSQPAEFKNLNFCDIKIDDYHYNPLPAIILSGNISLLNSVLHHPQFKPEWKGVKLGSLDLIHLALISGHGKMIEYVFNNFDPSQLVINTWTVLHSAVYSRSLESVKKVLNAIQTDPRFAMPPLPLATHAFHLAVSLGAVDIFEFLLNAPEFKTITIDITQTSSNFVLLLKAVASGSIDTIIKLRQLFHQRQIELDMNTETGGSLFFETHDILWRAENYPYIFKNQKPESDRVYICPKPHVELIKEALSRPLQHLPTFYKDPLPPEKKSSLFTLKNISLLSLVGVLIVGALAWGGIIPLGVLLVTLVAVATALYIGVVGRCILNAVTSAQRKRTLKAAAAPGNNPSLSSIPLASPKSTHAQVNTSISPLSSSGEAKRISTEDPFAAKGSGSSLPTPNMFQSHRVLREARENDEDSGLGPGLSLGGGISQ